MRTLNKTAQIEVVGEFIDPITSLEYTFSAKVLLNFERQVEVVIFTSINVYEDGEELDRDTACVLAGKRDVVENLEEIASRKAVEKAQVEDYSKECERE